MTGSQLQVERPRDVIDPLPLRLQYGKSRCGSTRADEVAPKSEGQAEQRPDSRATLGLPVFWVWPDRGIGGSIIPGGFLRAAIKDVV
jgi:hypothetical protein